MRGEGPAFGSRQRVPVVKALPNRDDPSAEITMERLQRVVLGQGASHAVGLLFGCGTSR